MTLPSQGVVADPPTEQNLQWIRTQFPIQAANIASAAVTDAKLASPANPVYRTVLRSEGAVVGGSFGAGKYFAQQDGTIGTSGATATSPLPIFYLVASRYAVTGLTTKLSVQAAVLTNATAPTITFTVGLYPVAVAGGANILVYTLGTVVAGSTVVITTPGASAVTNGTPSSDISLPADGAYALGVATSGTSAANAAVHISSSVQLRNT